MHAVHNQRRRSRQEIRLGAEERSKRSIWTIVKGEIFALLGPNGAGKTTLIGVICGLVSMTAGRVTIDGDDIVRRFSVCARENRISFPKKSRSTSSRRCGRPCNSVADCSAGAPTITFIEQLLRDLSLWEKRDSRLIELSGGMKRRVMIAKALSHEPDVLFLDEPTAGVDVNLRRDMWALVRKLSDRGVTIILTTHYIEEAEEMADRIGVINERPDSFWSRKRRRLCASSASGD